MKRHILDIKTTLSLPLQGITLIEASAGTGKTYTIGNLYVRLISEGFRVADILVVTFTVAATEELRGRIRQRLLQARQVLAGAGSSDPFLAEWAQQLGDRAAVETRLKQALRSMDEAAIYTINGFCQRALGEHAFHSRQPFELEMLTDDSELWQQVIRDWWRSATYPLNACHLALFSRVFKTIESLADLQRNLRDKQVEVIPEATMTTAEGYQQWQTWGDQHPELAQQWQQQRDALLELLNNSKALARNAKAYRKDNLQRWAGEWDAYFNAPTWWQQPASLAHLSYETMQANLLKNKDDPNLDEPFFNAIAQWLNRRDTLCHHFGIAALHEVHGFATAEVARIKQNDGLMSFHDQLARLAEALQQNEALGAALRQRFPVAMIDEFQDTDSLQYSIFERIYRQAYGMLMIGDPKQAIYGFRGGDIFAYIDAAADTAQQCTLDTNWRSTSAMIQAVNTVFAHNPAAPFVFDAISFEPVKAAPHAVGALQRGEQRMPALNFCTVAADSKDKSQSAAFAMPLIVDHVANSIAELLNEGAQGIATLGDRAVRAADIAVLVRTHSEGESIRQALQRRRIAAVVKAKTHVFASEEAEGLRLLLQAIAMPSDQASGRLALSSGLLALTYNAIAERCLDDDAWQTWCEQRQELHQYWQKQGFIPMFQRLLQCWGIADALSADAQAERRLTNVLHLAELLQQASRSRTMSALLHWFTAQSAAEDEAAELRLESDAERVRIVTIHASKGLEYPIVYLPTLWQCRPISSKDAAVSFYDEGAGQRCLDVGSDQHEEHSQHADRERLAEDVRLVYVALTRARSHMMIVWGHVGKQQPHTAMNWLLHGDSPLSPLQLDSDLNALCEESGGQVQRYPLPMDEQEAVYFTPTKTDAVHYSARPWQGVQQRDWRMLSFTAITRELPHPPFQRVTGDDAIFTFQPGKQTGVFLHSLLEHVDFQGDVVEAVQHFCSQQAARYGMQEDCAEVLAPWMEGVLHTALDEQGFCLADISRSQRLNELHFDFPLQKFDTRQWQRALERYAGRSLLPLGTAQYDGYMNGEIDLVFEHQGCYYLADYKGNALGSNLQDYAPAALRQTILQRRYDVQYIIYSLALHRYLSLRLPDYDYQQHFGGIYYLFLRGMRPQHGASFGVYHDKPPLELLESLVREGLSVS